VRWKQIAKNPIQGKTSAHLYRRSRFLEGKSLYQALVFKAKELDLAGATVFQGCMGYGANSRIHTASIISTDLPILIEIIDSEEYIQKFMPFLDIMVKEDWSQLTTWKSSNNGNKPPKHWLNGSEEWRHRIVATFKYKGFQPFAVGSPLMLVDKVGCFGDQNGDKRWWIWITWGKRRIVSINVRKSHLISQRLCSLLFVCLLNRIDYLGVNIERPLDQSSLYSIK